MAKARAVNIETPGAPTTEEEVAEPTAEEEATVETAQMEPSAPATSPPAANPVAVTTQEQIKQTALVDELEKTKALVGSSDALDWGHLNGRMAVLVNSRPDDRNLPDASTIDPSTIPFGRSVLTKQGYVCSTREDTRRFPK